VGDMDRSSSCPLLCSSLRERGRSSSVGFPFGAEDFGHLAWSIGQAGKYRRQGDARGDAGIGEKAD